MGAILKAVGGATASQFKANPSGFVVKLGRFLYSSTAGVIILAWYSSWRNERVQQGDFTNWPLPGMSKLKRQYSPDRPNPQTPTSVVGDFPNSFGGGEVPVIPDAKGQGKAITYDGKPVAAWIVPILKYARAHGWRGNVTSGYRTPAQQALLYRQRGANRNPVAQAGQSNHNYLDYPGGAVDVTLAPQLSSILEHSPYKGVLVWAGAKDPVHFSHPHDGGY